MYERFDTVVRSHPALYGLIGALAVLSTFALYAVLTGEVREMNSIVIIAVILLGAGIAQELLANS